MKMITMSSQTKKMAVMMTDTTSQTCPCKRLCGGVSLSVCTSG
jgi:hypothetical protein